MANLLFDNIHEETAWWDEAIGRISPDILRVLEAEANVLIPADVSDSDDDIASPRYGRAHLVTKLFATSSDTCTYDSKPCTIIIPHHQHQYHQQQHHHHHQQHQYQHHQQRHFSPPPPPPPPQSPPPPPLSGVQQQAAIVPAPSHLPSPPLPQSIPVLTINSDGGAPALPLVEPTNTRSNNKKRGTLAPPLPSKKSNNKRKTADYDRGNVEDDEDSSDSSSSGSSSSSDESDWQPASAAPSLAEMPFLIHPSLLSSMPPTQAPPKRRSSMPASYSSSTLLSSDSKTSLPTPTITGKRRHSTGSTSLMPSGGAALLLREDNEEGITGRNVSHIGIACDECRSKKVRCSGGSPCMQCENRGLQCLRSRSSRYSMKRTLIKKCKGPRKQPKAVAAAAAAAPPPPPPAGQNDATTTAAVVRRTKRVIVKANNTIPEGDDEDNDDEEEEKAENDPSWSKS